MSKVTVEIDKEQLIEDLKHQRDIISVEMNAYYDDEEIQTRISAKVLVFDSIILDLRMAGVLASEEWVMLKIGQRKND